jgi:polygalacturonase
MKMKSVADELTDRSGRTKVCRGVLTMSASRLAHIVIVLAASASMLEAQDSRNVSEPTVPDPGTVCSIQTAQLASLDGDVSPDDESHFDTARIQDALDNCPYGGTVELQPADGFDAFLVQPISIPSGVTLLIDAGATLYASRDPRDYDVADGSCGIIATSSPGCRALITISHAADAAIMGGGTINGRGGDQILGQDITWWGLARLAQQLQQSQFNPRLIQISNSTNLVLYQVTIINSPNFHVAINGGDGLTFWGVTIDTPYGSRNTDGIDPGNVTNVTITESSISDGDDNVALGAGGAPAANITVSNNHFGGGHGMSIGSFTGHGVSNVSVSDLNISGVAGDHVDSGLRIKSDRSRGGLVQNITYSNVCMQNVYNSLVFDPFYTASAVGTSIPDYQQIALHNVHVLTAGKLKLEGYDADHPLGLTLDNVIFDDIRATDITAANANITLGPGPVNLPPFTGTGVSIDDQTSNDDPPFSCSTVFPGAGPMLTVGATGDYLSIQDAVNALPPTGGTVNINPDGSPYTEVVHIETPNVRLVGLGTSPSDVVISYDNSAGTPDGNGGTLGVAGSATLFARGDGFVAENLTIQNTFAVEHDQDTGPGARAVALFVNADKAVFRHVRIIGRRSTLYARSKACSSGTCTPARQYFYRSDIEGAVDFIAGDAAAVFDHCTIRVDMNGSDAHRASTITAQSKRFDNYLSGYVFINSTIDADPGLTKLHLGRARRRFSTNVWLQTYMAGPVAGGGWVELRPGTTDNLTTAHFGEYRSFGPGASSSREPFAAQLGGADAHLWEPNVFLGGADGWRPTLIY